MHRTRTEDQGVEGRAERSAFLPRKARTIGKGSQWLPTRVRKRGETFGTAVRLDEVLVIERV